MSKNYEAILKRINSQLKSLEKNDHSPSPLSLHSLETSPNNVSSYPEEWSEKWYLNPPHVYYIATPIIILILLWYIRPKAVQNNTTYVNGSAGEISLENQRLMLGINSNDIDFKKLLKTTIILSVITWICIYYYTHKLQEFEKKG